MWSDQAQTQNFWAIRQIDFHITEGLYSDASQSSIEALGRQGAAGAMDSPSVAA